MTTLKLLSRPLQSLAQSTITVCSAEYRKSKWISSDPKRHSLAWRTGCVCGAVGVAAEERRSRFVHKEDGRPQAGVRQFVDTERFVSGYFLSRADGAVRQPLWRARLLARNSHETLQSDGVPKATQSIRGPRLYQHVP